MAIRRLCILVILAFLTVYGFADSLQKIVVRQVYPVGFADTDTIYRMGDALGRNESRMAGEIQDFQLIVYNKGKYWITKPREGTGKEFQDTEPFVIHFYLFNSAPIPELEYGKEEDFLKRYSIFPSQTDLFQSDRVATFHNDANTVRFYFGSTPFTPHRAELYSNESGSLVEAWDYEQYGTIANEDPHLFSKPNTVRYE